MLNYRYLLVRLLQVGGHNEGDLQPEKEGKLCG